MKKANVKLQFLFIITIVFSITGCTKDKLEGELEAFKGRYTWNYSLYKKHVLSSTLTRRQATQSNYTAEIEFTNKGKVIFYIDGEEIHKTGYSIKDQGNIGGNTITLEIDPRKEDSKNLDLNDKVSFALTNSDTLSNNNFPGDSYDNTVSGTHYFIRN